MNRRKSSANSLLEAPSFRVGRPQFTPMVASAETFKLSEKFPKSTQGENGIFLEYRQGSTYQLLDNRLDYDFPHLADSPWKIPMITCSDFVAGSPLCFRIGAHPSSYADAVLKIIIPGEGMTKKLIITLATTTYSMRIVAPLGFMEALDLRLGYRRIWALY